MSERPKVQISKVCVVHSHPGFESQRYRHHDPRHPDEELGAGDRCISFRRDRHFRMRSAVTPSTSYENVYLDGRY